MQSHVLGVIVDLCENLKVCMCVRTVCVCVCVCVSVCVCSGKFVQTVLNYACVCMCVCMYVAGSAACDVMAW